MRARRRWRIVPSIKTWPRWDAARAAGGCGRTLCFSARFRWRWIGFRKRLRKATLMVVVGTSGSVYPAANFVHWARQNGARTVYVGPERPLNAQAFTNVVLGKAGEVMPGLFQAE